jgi:gliding motility-associated protein GldL
MSGKKGGFFASKGYKNLMKYVYGYGASIVIVGALFKIQHWPGADLMLILGLSTEAIIFGLSAMEPLHAEPNWAVYYPYLLPEDERPDGQDISAFPKPHEMGGGAGGDAAEKLASSMKSAGINDNLLKDLGDSMRNLASNAQQLSNLSNAVTASNNYAQSLDDAASKISSLSSAYEEAAKSVAGINVMGNGVQDFTAQMTIATTNLEQLNQGLASVHSLKEVMNNLTDAAPNTEKFKDNMAALAQNLTDLNNVYGNMLKAMRS